MSYIIDDLKDNEINLYYSFTNLTENSLNEIEDNLSHSIFDKNENNIILNDFEIIILKCEYKKRKEERTNNITFKIEEYIEYNKTIDEIKEPNNDHGGLISAFLFLGIFIIIIIIFSIRNRNNKNIYYNTNFSSCLSENEKDY